MILVPTSEALEVTVLFAGIAATPEDLTGNRNGALGISCVVAATSISYPLLQRLAIVYGELE